ncbi:regulatory protein YcgZ [Klebsiella pneumoniae]|nr:regulatory protein YcgZ [Klebsiella pneumoniae]
MQQNGYIPDTANAIAQYFNKASLPSQQETLGQIVMDILNEGRHLNRKALCTKLLSCLDRRLSRRRKSRATIRPLIGLLFAGRE